MRSHLAAVAQRRLFSKSPPESEAAFVGKLKKIAHAKSLSTSEIGKKKPRGNK